jgi:hypothetical protein
MTINHQAAGLGAEKAIYQVLHWGDWWRYVFVVMVVLTVNDHGLPIKELVGLFTHVDAPGFGQHGAFQRFFMALQTALKWILGWIKVWTSQPLPAKTSKEACKAVCNKGPL